MAATAESEIRRAQASDAGAVAQLLHDFNVEYEDYTPGVPALTERLTELLASGAIAALLAGDPIATAREAGADHFELTTGEDDRAAIALYESRSFTNREGGPDGPRMLYYELDL